MHCSGILALAFVLAPTWAVPLQDLTGLDISPAAVPLDKLNLDLPSGDLKVLRPKVPKFSGTIDFTLKKNIALNWNDG
jgi:hypothetical protein